MDGVLQSTVRFLPALASLWLGMLLLLVVLGRALSGTALRVASDVRGDAQSTAQGMGASARRIYRTVLWLSCTYYYTSLPLMALLVIGIAAGLIYAMSSTGRLPIRFVLFILVVLGVTLWAMLRSLFVRARDVDPGARFAPHEFPRLEGVLREVADVVGTDPLNTLFIVPGTDLAVFERGGLIGHMRGRAERCLILGVGLLDGFPLRAFKAVLAHEYGHLSNRDTAGGRFALAVRRSLSAMAEGLAKGGAAQWYNPAWLFVTGFSRVFMRISQGASRLQEVAADRWAAVSYGSASFERGLRHVIERGVRFMHHANASITEVIEHPQPLSNLYAFRPRAVPSESEVQVELAAAFASVETDWDSHPAPSQRVALVNKLSAPGRAASDDDEQPAWSLFEDRERLERLMTDWVRSSVHDQHGILIPTGKA